MNNQNKEFSIIIDGELSIAKGDGWRLVSCGNKRLFTQTKKLPSIRTIKTVVKALTCLK